ncbi:extracellular solute-binding protein, partial [Streptomyces sp. NPDC006356]
FIQFAGLGSLNGVDGLQAEFSAENVKGDRATYGATALSFLDDLVAKGSLSEQCVGWTQQDVNTRFLNQRAAMQINGPWQIPTLKEADFDWAVVALPRDKEAATCLGGENWVLMASSDHLDKAWEVLEYTQRPSVLTPYLVSFGNLPARKDLADRGAWASDPALRLFLSQLPLARPRQYGPHYADASQAVAEAEQAVLTGSAAATAAARTAAGKIDKALGER